MTHTLSFSRKAALATSVFLASTFGPLMPPTPVHAKNPDGGYTELKKVTKERLNVPMAPVAVCQMTPGDSFTFGLTWRAMYDVSVINRDTNGATVEFSVPVKIVGEAIILTTVRATFQIQLSLAEMTSYDQMFCLLAKRSTPAAVSHQTSREIPYAGQDECRRFAHTKHEISGEKLNELGFNLAMTFNGKPVQVTRVHLDLEVSGKTAQFTSTPYKVCVDGYTYLVPSCSHPVYSEIFMSEHSSDQNPACK